MTEKSLEVAGGRLDCRGKMAEKDTRRWPEDGRKVVGEEEENFKNFDVEDLLKGNHITYFPLVLIPCKKIDIYIYTKRMYYIE